MRDLERGRRMAEAREAEDSGGGEGTGEHMAAGNDAGKGHGSPPWGMPRG